MLDVSETDVAILGGGCAGLSLAVQLAEREDCLQRVVVLEARSEYQRDRTWCGWSVQPHPFAECVDHAWTEWEARFRGAAAVHRSTAMPYEHIRGDAFYQSAQRRIADAANVDLFMGVSALEVRSRGDRFEIVTEAGTLLARRVVDTRPPSAAAPKGALLQHFVGQEIETEAPVFNPGRATLMDFDVDQVGGLHFIYVLPFTERRALVESTVLSPEPLDRSVYLDQIINYVRGTLQTEVSSVGFTESGVIPMYAVAATVDETEANRIAGLDRAGTLGGAIKPSSGYGFHAIQERSAALADSLSTGAPPAGPAFSARLDSWMDSIFLGFLRSHPERGPEVFHRMFQRVPASTLARFLMGRPGVADRLRVVGAMPKLPFLRQALRTSLS